MKWLCLLRLLGFLVVARAAPQLRANSFVDVSRHRESSHVWDYSDEGQSWTSGKCANTEEWDQSPVNISTTVAAVPKDNYHFYFDYPAYETPVKMVNDGRFLYTKIPNEDGKVGAISLGTSYPNHLEDRWFIYKMMIHTPSEHTYNGVKVPLELQLFHRKEMAELDKDGEPHAMETAIVAVGFEESQDEASPFLRSLIDGGLPDQRGGTTMDNREHPSVLKFSELFKPVFGDQGQKAGFWDYTGTLTQPPCSGGTRWFIRQQAMNAKRKTLRYFADVVKKASGGVQNNARALQVIGTRPVFPRFATNAVHMKVFETEEPAAFKEAYARVKTHQKAFKEGLNADSKGSANALADGADAKEALASSRELNNCLDDLGTLTGELQITNNKKTEECNKAKSYQKTMENISGGPARIEAAAKSSSAHKACEDASKVSSAKTGQREELQGQCDTIKADVSKKAEKAIAEKANAEAEAKAAETATA